VARYQLVATLRSGHGHVVAEQTAWFYVLEEPDVPVLLEQARRELRAAAGDIEEAAEDLSEAIGEGFRALRTGREAP
jgi:hypothetical protein